MSKYVAELANSVGEAKLKISDVPAIVEFCCAVHQRYVDFSQNLLDNHFKKVMPRKRDDQVRCEFIDLKLSTQVIILFR